MSGTYTSGPAWERVIYGLPETPPPTPAELPSYEEWVKSAAGKLTTDGVFASPHEGVNFMLEGLRPEEVYATAKHIAEGGAWSDDNRQGGYDLWAQVAALLNTDWRPGPNNGGGFLGGIGNALQGTWDGIRTNPALMAAFTAGVLNPGISSLASKVPGGEMLLKVPGARSGITTLLTTGDPRRALTAGVTGGVASTAKDFLQDVIPGDNAVTDYLIGKASSAVAKKLGEAVGGTPTKRATSDVQQAATSNAAAAGNAGAAGYAQVYGPAATHYGGKDFSSQKRRVNAAGQLLADPYRAPSTVQAGAEVEIPSDTTVATKDETKDNPMQRLAALADFYEADDYA